MDSIHEASPHHLPKVPPLNTIARDRGVVFNVSVWGGGHRVVGSIEDVVLCMVGNKWAFKGGGGGCDAVSEHQGDIIGTV